MNGDLTLSGKKSDGGGIAALSGGVDSAAAAATLREAGERPNGVFMRHRFQPTLSPEESARRFDAERDNPPTLWRLDESGGFVESVWTPERFDLPVDAAAAWEIARFLDIPFALFDAEPLFERVTDDFVANYLDGRTPNPCVLCNRILKFGALVKLARFLNADYFATGHYVSTRSAGEWRRSAAAGQAENLPAGPFAPLPDYLAEEPEERVALLRSPWEKDQSYVLWNIERSVLPFLKFPVGALQKKDVRNYAAAKKIPVTLDDESQDVCFIPDGSHAQFVRAHGDGRETAGAFVSLDGTVLGEHAGYEKYTVGQRKGLGVGFGERTFVQRIDAASRRVVLGPYEALATSEVTAKDANWLVDVPLEEPFRCAVKVRYRNRPVGASVTARRDGTIRAALDEPRYGVAPGQSLVCYFADRLLGGGVIQ